MDAAFSSIAFAEPVTAEANLAALEKLLPDALWAALPALVGQLPDPDGALNFLERYLRAADARLTFHLSRYPAALHYLLVIFSHSNFLSESLVQQPELILWLSRRPPGEGLQRARSREDLHEEFARFAATAIDQPLTLLLARFKRREYLRVTLRDVLGLATLGETTLELSQLADTLIEEALRFSEQKLENAYGVPGHVDTAGRVQATRMAVISLGKLGGQELNYSSDIDLMFVYGENGETGGGSQGRIANSEYFTRLAQAVLKILSQATPEGAVYRVDLRLRPEGRLGDVAVSASTAAEYYRTRAREWELQMLIKARISAGDAEAGRRLLRVVAPLIYREKPDIAAVEAALNAREEISRELQRNPGAAGQYRAAWNVKLTPGGIRDIEFLTQCLQRLYGGTETWLAGSAAGSTLVALQRLHDKQRLAGRDFFRLATAYEFLRKIEHRLQLRDGLQRHGLPDSPQGLTRLARRCGIEALGHRSAGEQLRQRVAQHFAEVREIYERLLKPRSGEMLRTASRADSDPASGNRGPLDRLQNEFPQLGSVLLQAGAPENVFARRGLQNFLGSALLDPELMQSLEEHPEWLERACQLFERSDHLAEIFARDPQAVRLLAEERATSPEVHLTGANEGLWKFRKTPGKASGGPMGELRSAYRRSVTGALIAALCAREPFATFGALSGLAEAALKGTLQFVAQERGVRQPAETAKATPAEFDCKRLPFAVLALGRLGTLEFDIGSDADLVFVTGDASDAIQPLWRRVAERLVHVASSHTREGLLFAVDTRLRPRGSEGEILQSPHSLAEYFCGEAEGWEAATYLKARVVGGNPELGQRAIELVQGALAERYEAAGSEAVRALARQLAYTREKLEKETPKGGFKAAAGGFYDIEYILALMVLQHGRQLGGGQGNILWQISRVEGAGLLAPGPAQILRGSALLYRGAEHANRLLTGQPAAQLPEPAQIPRVERLLGEWKIPVADGLEQAITAARKQVRNLYEEFVLAAT